jgi:hypothetical protein
MPSQTRFLLPAHRASVSRFHLIFTVYAAASPLDLRNRPAAVPGQARAWGLAVEGAIFERRNADMLDPWAKRTHRNGTHSSTAPGCPGSAVTLPPDPARSVGYRNLPRNREMVLA